MEKNQIEIVEINNLGINGEGIARFENEVIFVPFALPKEKVKVQCINNKNKFSIMKVNEIITQSKDRVLSKCPYFKKCGGCELQHLNYQKQIEFKTNLVKETLQKVGNIETVIENCEPSEKQYYYRNKASFPIILDGGYKIGMFRVNSHNLVDIDYCYIQKENINRVLSIVINWLNEINTYFDLQNIALNYNSQINNSKIIKNLQNETSYQQKHINNDSSLQNETSYQQKHINNDKILLNTNLKTNKKQCFTNFDKLKFLVIREVDNKLLITLVATGINLPMLDKLISSLNNKFNNFGLNININNFNNNVILSNKYKHIYGNKSLQINSHNVDLQITNASFYQVNDYIKDKIYDEVLNQIDNEIVIDAFSGAGLLTSMIANKAKKVYGIEIVEDAVNSSNELMKINNITNVDNICGDCTIKLPELIKNINEKVTVVLDPPRKGCDKKVLNAIIESNAFKIIYIACNPISLARDVKILIENGGYKINYVKPFDMFPQTKNVETLMVLTK